MKKYFFLTLILGCAALANGGEHSASGEEGGIPFEQIGWQAVNLGILLVAVFIFIRKSVIETFKKRQSDYLAQTEKTKTLMKEAEAALTEIKSRLSALEVGEQKSIETSKQEAIVARDNIIKEAELATEKMKRDAELSIKNELNKAKAEINSAILNQAIAATTQRLSVASSQAASQEANFVKQLEQVKP